MRSALLALLLSLPFSCAHRAPPTDAAQATGPASESPLGAFSWASGDLVLDDTDPAMGAPSAGVTVVVFNDYQCPYCARMAPRLEALAGADVRVIYREYPLDSACNPAVSRPFHPAACAAAVAAECAREQDRFWEMNQILFRSLPERGADGIGAMAREAGLASDRFARCVEGGGALAAIQADMRAGVAAGVMGTPNLFVHGLYGDRWIDVGGALETVEALLRMRARGETLPEPGAPQTSGG